MSLRDIVFVEHGEQLATGLYLEGRSRYRCSIHIDAAPEPLDYISHVRYSLRSYYATGFRFVRWRATRFQLSQLGQLQVADRALTGRELAVCAPRLRSPLTSASQS